MSVQGRAHAALVAFRFEALFLDRPPTAKLAVAIERLLRLGPAEAQAIGLGFRVAFAPLTFLACAPEIDDLAHVTVTDFAMPRVHTMR